MADLTIEQKLLRVVTEYIDEQRGGKILTPDSMTIVTYANSIRAILTLQLIEQGKKL